MEKKFPWENIWFMKIREKGTSITIEEIQSGNLL
jgi:hypothetical protein